MNQIHTTNRKGEYTMLSTGIVRKMDPLGRIVIPMELRRRYGIEEGDPLEIYVDGETIILKPYDATKTCGITGERAILSIPDTNIHLSEEGCIRLLQELKAVIR